MHRSTSFLPAFWGLAFAVVTMVVHLCLGREMSVLVASLLMAMIGSVYVGFAISDGRTGAIMIEFVGALGFASAAMCGILVSPWFIVAALVGHACWDFLHHRPGRWATTPRWYVPYCVVYDVLAAVGLAVLWFSRGVLAL